VHPILFHWGSTPISSFSLILNLAAFLGVGLWIWQSKRSGLEFSSEALMKTGLLALIGAWVGAKSFFFVLNPDRLDGWVSLWQGGLVFYGGLGIGSLVLWIGLRTQNLWHPTLLAAATPALAYAQAIGRLGCFMNGCCHGTLCSHPWGVAFSDIHSAARPLNTPLHPTQLYESVGLLALGSLLWVQGPRLGFRAVGRYLWLAAGLRLFTENFRGDELRGFWGPLSSAQVIASVLFFLGVLLDFGRLGHHKRSHEN
jgi:phosphatidylglycerol:prolipoprotein diacylglycerol transferase